MSVGLKRISGVESVTVSLNEGLATIRLKPGNSVRLEQVWQSVKDNGFTPREAKVSAHGEVIFSDSKLQFRLRGTDQLYDLVVDPKAERISKEIRQQTGKILLVEGVIPAPDDKTGPRTIHLTGFEGSSERSR